MSGSGTEEGIGWDPLLGHSFIECLISTGHEDSGDGYNNPLNLSKVNSSDRSPGNEMDSLLIIEQDNCPENEERGDSDESLRILEVPGTLKHL